MKSPGHQDPYDRCEIWGKSTKRYRTHDFIKVIFSHNFGWNVKTKCCKFVVNTPAVRAHVLTLGWTLGFDSHNPISWVNNYKIITLVQHHLGSIQQSGSLPPLVCLMSSKDPYYTPIRWHSCFLTSRAWLCWLVTLPWPNQFHYSGYSPRPGKAVPLNFSSCSNRSIACTPAKVPFKVHLFQAII